MAKRKSVVLEQQEREKGSEDEEEASSDLSGSGEEDLDELQELDEDFAGGEDSDLSGSEEEDLDEQQELEGEISGGEDYDDAVGKGEGQGGEEEQEQRQEAEGSTAFGRAFGKIMKKRVPQSAFTEISGPVLAERKQLLVQKFEEAEIEGKAKISGKEEKREAREKGHVLPQTYTDAKEKALIKLATKGVVRLFNAVSKAQKVQANADISSNKAAKATWKQSKAAFMTELRASSKSGLRANAPDGISGQHEEKEAEPGWAALRSDFMLGTSNKLVDWDKNLADSVPATES